VIGVYLSEPESQTLWVTEYGCCDDFGGWGGSVGWVIDSSDDTALVVNDLTMAIELRRATNETVIHSDHGVQFTSWGFSEHATNYGLLTSMGTIGDYFDNTVIESFWSRVQVELLDRQSWETRLQLSAAMSDYIEVFHNRQRRHSALGMLSPVELELRFIHLTVVQLKKSAYTKHGTYQSLWETQSESMMSML